MSSLRPLLGRTLVLVAHPDDEAVGCGALIQRMQDPLVIFATDGAPRSDCFWQKYHSREEYARVRAQEASQALAAVGVQHFHLLCDAKPIMDQELYTQLDRACDALSDVVESEMPDAILSLAYEGGHPDHDACAFLAAFAGNRFEVPVWEMPLYHRDKNRIEITRQSFLSDDNSSLEPNVSGEELVRKMNMFAAYDSQTGVLREFLLNIERFRPMKFYDFTQPPHAGILNYEAWQWPMKGEDLCRAFSHFLQSHPSRKREWGTAA